MENKKVAWIGTGVMGSQQASHLAKHGYTVSAYTHRYEKLLELQQQFGIIPCKTIAEAVQDVDYIFVMVGYPSDVKEVFCDRGGIFDSCLLYTSCGMACHFSCRNSAGWWNIHVSGIKHATT